MPRRPLSEHDPMRLASLRRVEIALGALFGLTLLGTTGYMAIEGLPFVEALYMTVITQMITWSRSDAIARCMPLLPMTRRSPAPAASGWPARAR